MQQQALVAQQFGNTASAYLSSTVHAQGADLTALRAIVDDLRASAGAPRVLDLGCGAGHASFAVAPAAASVIAYDLSAQMLDVVAGASRERGLDNITTVQGDVARLPFDDAAFDLVLTRFSAHHWRDVPAALREVRRVLRPHGTLLVSDIIAPETPLHDSTLQAVELLRDASHVRDYRRSEWTAMLAAAGFDHEHISAWKLEMAFDSWVARMRTPPQRVAAIRDLFDTAPEETRGYFAVRPDHSFSIDACLLRGRLRVADIY